MRLIRPPETQASPLHTVMKTRDRIQDLRRVKAADLLPIPPTGGSIHQPKSIRLEVLQYSEVDRVGKRRIEARRSVW